MSDPVLPEGVQAVVNEAQMREVRQFVDSRPLEAPPEDVKDVKPPKASKLEQKRQEIFLNRLKRKMGEKNKSGELKTQEQALREIAREDYDALPIEKKLARLEHMVSSALQHLSQDTYALRQNDSSIAEAFDINYRAIEKMFTKLGLTGEQQKEFIEEARKEVREERQREIQEQLAAQRKAQEDAERARIEGELKKAEQKPLQAAAEPPNEADPHVQEGATVFGS